MTSPIWVSLTSSATGVTTKVRIRQNEPLPFDFTSDEFEVVVSPEDRLDTTFTLGRLDFRNMAKRLGNTPVTLRGDFRYVYSPADGFMHDTRVAVHADIPRPGGHETLSAYLPVDLSTAEGIAQENADVLITSVDYVQLVQTQLVFR